MYKTMKYIGIIGFLVFVLVMIALLGVYVSSLFPNNQEQKDVDTSKQIEVEAEKILNHSVQEDIGRVWYWATVSQITDAEDVALLEFTFHDDTTIHQLYLGKQERNVGVAFSDEYHFDKYFALRFPEWGRSSVQDLASEIQPGDNIIFSVHYTEQKAPDDCSDICTSYLESLGQYIEANKQLSELLSNDTKPEQPMTIGPVIQMIIQQI